ncbi:pimeloyl-ACP methyl ester carboxylesterase [Kitasatospora sp. MAA19]|uniref:alpha/beta hydrolase n=1 Tax=unclassified Kitasatospora TaxID=2633591 RepID=UPI00247498E1|nr:alpha/beta fold hydrolase [Kitasatospora sp. MAA19]MDH6703914.1 pimeloyl-ACP methyl ester carboxylesterase [Kitasatospora sp. MAA19]
MSTFVLVPGFWLGAWAWDEVAAPLRAAGHTVHAVTLPGVAERAGDAGPIGLAEHVAALADLLVREDLWEVVLVAHSGACAPVGGVADRMPERIRRVVYLDSGPVVDGGSLYDIWRPDYRALADASVVGGRLPMPSWADLAANGADQEGLDEAALARIRERATPHPAGAYRDRLRLTGAAAGLPQALVSCSFPLARVHAMVAAGHPWFVGLDGPNWELRELPTGHWPMFSRPADTAAVLAELAAL